MPLMIKAGATVAGLQAPMLEVIAVAMPIWRMYGVETFTITSGLRDWGVENSRHKDGLAVDIRIWGLQDPHRAAETLAHVLGDTYDVLLMADHVHVEWDPKPYTPGSKVGGTLIDRT